MINIVHIAVGSWGPNLLRILHKIPLLLMYPEPKRQQIEYVVEYITDALSPNMRSQLLVGDFTC